MLPALWNVSREAPHAPLPPRLVGRSICIKTRLMAKVTIDGIEVEVQDGINVIEAAKAADIHVPHFCYRPSLSIVGQCRMCLVEVEGMPKLQAGCATPVKDGMKIAVWNDKVDKARKGQMEFLLINNQLDCPICDKADMCML